MILSQRREALKEGIKVSKGYLVINSYSSAALSPFNIQMLI